MSKAIKITRTKVPADYDLGASNFFGIPSSGYDDSDSELPPPARFD